MQEAAEVGEGRGMTAVYEQLGHHFRFVRYAVLEALGKIVSKGDDCAITACFKNTPWNHLVHRSSRG